MWAVAAGIIRQWIDTWRPRENSDTELGLIIILSYTVSKSVRSLRTE